MRRLDVARLRLASLVPGARPVDAGLINPYILPPLSDVETAKDAATVRAALEASRRRQRALLLLQATGQLEAFLQAQDRRQDLLIAQRRAELEAAGRAGEERQAREVREQEAADVRARIGAKAPDLLNRQLPVSVLRAQLAPGQEVVQPDPTPQMQNPPPVVLMAPAVDQKTLEDEIATLQKDPKTPGISMRARYTLKLRRSVQRLRSLREEINAILLKGEANVNARVAALQEARLAEIEAELEALRDDTEGMFLVRSQRVALGRVLSQEEALAATTQSLSGLNASQPDKTVAAAARFESLFGSSATGGIGPVASVLGVRAALRRINQQQQHLKQFVISDVRDSVRDAAETHRVDVAFTPDPKRKDLTEQFARWIGLQGELGAALPPATGTTARGSHKG